MSRSPTTWKTIAATRDHLARGYLDTEQATVGGAVTAARITVENGGVAGRR